MKRVWKPLVAFGLLSIICVALAAWQQQNFPGGGAAGGINAQSSAYTAIASDSGKLITQSTNGANVTLPNPAPSATWFVTIKNNSSGNIAIVPNGLTLDGSASNFVISAGAVIAVYSNGTNYFSSLAAGGVNVGFSNAQATSSNSWTIGSIQNTVGTAKFAGTSGQVNAATGALQLVNGGSANGAIGWRNNASTGDLLLVPNTSDVLTYQQGSGNQHPMRPIEQGSCAMAAATTD